MAAMLLFFAFASKLRRYRHDVPRKSVSPPPPPLTLGQGITPKVHSLSQVASLACLSMSPLPPPLRLQRAANWSRCRACIPPLHKPLCCNLQSIHSSRLLHLELLRLTQLSPSSASSLSSFRRYQRLSIPLFSYQGLRRQCQSSSPKNSTPHSPALVAGILGIVLCIAARTMRAI